MSEENKKQFQLPIEEETDDFPDEYGLDAHNASDYLPSPVQCKNLIQKFV